MGSSDKKGAELDKDKAGKAASSTETAKLDNIFGRHGNEQIQAVTGAALAGKEAESGLLATMMGDEQSNSAEQQWWQDEEVAANAKEEEDEQIVRSNAVDDDAQRAEQKQQADKDAERGRRLAPQEEYALLQEKKSQMSAGALAASEINLMKDADKAGMDDEAKAAMLVKAGDVSKEVLDQQTGSVRTLVAAEQMPDALAGFHREAAPEASKTPLDERDTIRNVTEELRLISQQMQAHPKLNDPNLSVEEKATALVDILAYGLDVPTRESVAAHPFLGLHEDLVFDPQSILAINSIAGSSREVRALGSFAIVAWQLAVDTVKNRLSGMDDSDVIQEDEIWKESLGGLASKMYVDALMKPSAT